MSLQDGLDFFAWGMGKWLVKNVKEDLKKKKVKKKIIVFHHVCLIKRMQK